MKTTIISSQFDSILTKCFANKWLIQVIFADKELLGLIEMSSPCRNPNYYLIEIIEDETGFKKLSENSVRFTLDEILGITYWEVKINPRNIILPQ